MSTQHPDGGVALILSDVPGEGNTWYGAYNHREATHIAFPVAQAARLIDPSDPAIRREIADAIATRVNDRMLSWEAVADHVAERLKLIAALQKGTPDA